ncbi:MAG: bile acid:sodium symporter [Proteobacteria bacterium]|nr:bile acid:sodium symporter [Pseudomonadota bacterium]
MESAWSQILGPAILFALMIVVGLQLSVADFRRVLEVPRAVVAGTAGQILFLPAMAAAIVYLFGIEPMLGVGAVLLAAAPGAALSNVLTAVARGHVALSVTLTAVSSVLAVLTIPGLTALSMHLFLGDAAEVRVPFLEVAGQLVLYLLLPILLGMRIRAWRPDSAARYIQWANRIAIVGIVALTVLGVMTGSSDLPSGAAFGRSALAALVWTVCAMGLGWGIATLLRLDLRDRFTFLIEFSARNLGLAMIVALASFQSLELALFGGVYSMSGFPLVIGTAVLIGRIAGRREAAAGSSG